MATDSISAARPPWKRTEKFGVLVMLAGLVVFATLTAMLAVPETQQFDEEMVRNLRRLDDPSRPIGPAWFQELARDFTALGGYGVLVTITVLITTFLHLERRPARGHFVLAVIVSAYLLSMILKQLIGRPRPEIVPWLSHFHSPSFPSAHSMMSAVTYLSLGLMLSDLSSRRAVKVFVVVAPLTVSAFVSFSRVYMGVHYPTDVIAGWSLGMSWALVCWLVVRRWRAFRAVRRVLDSENEVAK